MNVFVKLALRRPYLTVLLVLLLFTSIALSGVSYSAWCSSSELIQTISDDYTTVAIPKNIELSVLLDREAGNAAVVKQGCAFRAAEKAPYVRAIDHRGYLAAHTPGKTGLSSASADPAEYNYVFEDDCYSLAVFAVRCDRVQTTGNIHTKFTVLEAVSMMDAYDTFPPPESITVPRQSGFTEGKTYLIFGQYHDHPVYPTDITETGYGQKKSDTRTLLPYPQIPWNETALPWYAQYDGSVEAFLASNEGQVWRTEILPLCKLNHESVGVVLTDDVTSIYEFNNGQAPLLHGRFFTREELETGAMVCIISAAYADLHGYSLGDKLKLEFYNTTMFEFANGANAYDDSFRDYDPGPYLHRMLLKPENAIDYSGEYTIVGIYTGVTFDFGHYHFNADNCFIPKASVPDADAYGNVISLLLNSYVLENGTQEEFEAYMASCTEELPGGLGGMFLYFDQNYTAMEESLMTLEGNALRLLLIGMLMLGVAGALFLYLNFRAITPIIRSVRLLGLSQKRVFREVLAVLLTQVVLAVVLGCLTAALLYDTMTEVLFSAAIALDLGAVVTIGTVSLGLLVLSTLLCATAAVKKKLM